MLIPTELGGASQEQRQYILQIESDVTGLVTNAKRLHSVGVL